MLKKIILFSLINFKAFAIVGSEIPLLVELVSQTTSQLNELERIVSNGERLTKKMVEYNEVMEDHYFRAERIKVLTEELTAKRKAENLGELNFHLRALKEAMLDTKRAFSHYQGLVKTEVKKERLSAAQKEILLKRIRLARMLQERSEKGGSVKESNRLTSQNTALSLESILKSEGHLNEINHQVATTNRLISEAALKDRLKKERKKDFYKGLIMDSHNQLGGKNARKSPLN